MLRKSCLWTSLLVLAAILMVMPANAATRIWTGTIGNWSDPANWGGTEPMQMDYAIIRNSGTVNITQADETCRSLYLADFSGIDKQGMVQMTAGSLQASVVVGYYGQGYFKQTGGSVTGGLQVANQQGSVGKYYLSGGDLNISSQSYIGYSGTGYFIQTGGKANVGALYLGQNTSSWGQYTLAGPSELTIGTLYVGKDGEGIFQQSAGNCSVNNGLTIAAAGFTHNRYTLEGTGSLTVKTGGINITGHQNYPGRFEWFVNNLSTSAITSYGQLAIGFDFDVNALKSGSLFHGTSCSIPGILEITRGSTATQSGGNPISIGTLHVGSRSGTGNYRLADNAQLSLANLSVGYYGTGSFEQSSGSINVSDTLRIGEDSYSYYGEAHGKYTLSGTGVINLTATSGTIYIGSGRFEWFRNGGLTAWGLRVGSFGTLAMGFDFNLSSLLDKSLFNGQLIRGIESSYSIETSNGNLEITNGATATQANTSVALSGLTVGSSTGSGTYILSGTSLLKAVGMERIGDDDAGSGLFQQTGGTNQANLLSIGKSGRYELKGGTLTINSGFHNEGVLDCGNSSAILNIPGNSILDMSKGSIINAKNIPLNIPANSILMISPGFDPLSIFKSYSNTGLYHTVGTPLVIAAGKSFGGMGTIDDPVHCSGGLTATGGSYQYGQINLNRGVVVTGGGINLKDGYVICDDIVSGITNGGLTAKDQYIGKSQSGVFTVSAGNSTLTQSLYLGYDAGVSGTYHLTGTSQLNVTNDNVMEVSLAVCEYIGYSGEGVFNQSAGTNKIYGTRGALYLGYNPGSSGTYNLSGTGQLKIYKGIQNGNWGVYELFFNEYVGYSGTGVFNQSGGVHEVSGVFSPFTETTIGGLYIGHNSGSHGTYRLSGSGQLTSPTIWVGNSLNANGTLTISDSAKVIAGTIYFGHDSGSSSSCSISGGIIGAYNLYLGYSGSCVYTQSGGATADQFSGYIPSIFLAVEPGSSTTLNIVGGVLAAKSIQKGMGTSVFNLGGGTIRSYGSLADIPIPMTLTGINGNATFDIYSGTTTISGLLAGPGGLNKLSSGTLTLKEKNSYHGDTMVQGGILRIEGGIDPLGTSLIDVKTSGKALFKTTNINSPDLDICTTGTGIFEIVDGTHVVGSITGTGTTQVDAAGHLTATSIVQNTLKIGGIGSAAATSSASDDSALSVPEPASILLLGIAVVGFASAWKRRSLEPTNK